MARGGVRSGFTIVELLIVVVVIAILAAITIVAYNGIQNQAHDSSIQSDLANNGKQLMRYQAERGALPTALTSVDIRASRGSYLTSRNNMYFCINTTTGRFALSSISKSGQGYQNVDGTISKTASQLWGADTCNLIGSGTVAGGYDQSGGSGWQVWVNG